MSVKKKHVKTFESVQKRMGQITYQIEELKAELQELVNHENDFKFNTEITLRSIKDEYGVIPTNWVL